MLFCRRIKTHQSRPCIHVVWEIDVSDRPFQIDHQGDSSFLSDFRDLCFLFQSPYTSSWLRYSFDTFFKVLLGAAAADSQEGLRLWGVYHLSTLRYICVGTENHSLGTIVM
jgi:hypothetical protein